MLTLLKLGKWLLSKSVVLIVIGLIAVAVFALWIFLQRTYDSEGVRVEKLTEYQAQASELYSKLEDAHVRLIELAEGIEKSRRKIEAASEIIDYLDGILNRIERFITMSSAERSEAESRLEEARRTKDEQESLRKELISEQSNLRIERLKLSEKAKALESELTKLESHASTYLDTLAESWRRMKPILLWALVAVVLLPIIWKLLAFYIWAPLLSAAGPIRIEKEQLTMPRRAGGGVSTQVKLEQGQSLWIKESFLQASDECLSRKTRLLLDWRIPATCLAAGLVELIELKSKTEEIGSVTVSPQKRAELEIAVIELPESSKMVVRPSSLAGLISREGQSVRIGRRWRLFHPQAWLTFQFRYFVFHGPCALIVSGVRGVRFEKLDTVGGKGRRSNQIATIGFTPDLGYGVVRAETFWSYFRGFNPLFDDVFRGQGAFLCQEISEDEATKASRFWGNVWNGLLKVLGV